MINQIDDKIFNYFDINSLRSLNNTTGNQDDKDLKVVAQQLGSVFLEMVIKEMHNSNEPLKSELTSSKSQDFYQDILNQQLSMSLSKSGGIGIAQVILKQLSPKTNRINSPLVKEV